MSPPKTIALSAPVKQSQTRNRTLRIRAIPISVLVIVESVLGDPLARAGSPYPLGYLAAHIGLALLLVAFAAHAFVISIRLPSWPARVAACVTFLCALGATIDGTVFLLGGQSRSSLYGMEALAVVALLGAILLFAWGSVAIPASPVSTG